MGKFYIIMGKSATGKDSMYHQIKNSDLELQTIVPFTTRPIREGETDGVEYHFIDEEKFNEMFLENRVIEFRKYQTNHGEWIYGTPTDNIDLDKSNYIAIGTLETFESYKNHFGDDKVVDIYIHVDDGDRLQRALNREKQETTPKYEEMCRRFIADSEDFSKEKIAESNITNFFENYDFQNCFNQIITFIRETINIDKAEKVQNTYIEKKL